MGTFGGHALPGSFFIVIGVWHVVQIFRRYYQSKRESSAYVRTLWFTLDCCCGRLSEWPIEPVLKIFCTGVGLFLEIYTGTRNGVFDAPGNEQHATMFFFFGLTGVFDLLTHYKASIPPMFNYISFFLAFSIEFILFKFHLHGRTDMDVVVHTFLLYTIGASLIMIVVEMKYRNNFTVSVVTSYLILLQGTWFWHIGFILYNPIPNALVWDQENHKHIMMVTTYFSWHVGFNLIFVVCIGALISCIYKRKYGYSDDDSSASKRLIHTNLNGQTIVNLNDDSEEEGEF